MKLKDLLQRIQDEYIFMELEHPGCLEDKFKDNHHCLAMGLE